MDGRGGEGRKEGVEGKGWGAIQFLASGRYSLSYRTPLTAADFELC